MQLDDSPVMQQPISLAPMTVTTEPAIEPTPAPTSEPTTTTEPTAEPTAEPSPTPTPEATSTSTAEPTSAPEPTQVVLDADQFGTGILGLALLVSIAAINMVRGFRR